MVKIPKYFSKGEDSNDHKNETERQNSTEERADVRRLAMVILGAILVFTIMAAYSNSILRDNEKLTGQLLAAKADRDQALEKTVVTRFDELTGAEDFGTGGNNLKIKVSNDGPMPSIYRFVLLYCYSSPAYSCPQGSGVPVINPLTVSPFPPTVLNPGEEREFQVGPVYDGLEYRVDIVTDRGNVLSTPSCLVDLTTHTCKDGQSTHMPTQKIITRP